MRILTNPILRDLVRVVKHHSVLTDWFKGRLLTNLDALDAELTELRELVAGPCENHPKEWADYSYYLSRAVSVLHENVPALLEDYRRLQAVGGSEHLRPQVNTLQDRLRLAEAERDALLERWAALKAWATEQHRLSMGASRLVEVSDVVQKMGELEARDA